MRLGLRVALLREAGVEKPAAGLPELNSSVVQQQVQLLCRQSIVFGDFRDRQQRVRLEHHVVVGDLRGDLKQGLLCRQPFGPLGPKVDDGMLEELIVVQELVDGVDTVAADDG